MRLRSFIVLLLLLALVAGRIQRLKQGALKAKESGVFDSITDMWNGNDDNAGSAQPVITPQPTPTPSSPENDDSGSMWDRVKDAADDLWKKVTTPDVTPPVTPDVDTDYPDIVIPNIETPPLPPIPPIPPLPTTTTTTTTTTTVCQYWIPNYPACCEKCPYKAPLCESQYARDYAALDSTSASAHNGFRKLALNFCEYFQNTVEGECRFNQLYPNIKQDRIDHPGYTGCVVFAPAALQYAASQSRVSLITTANPNDCVASYRKRLPVGAYHCAMPKSDNPYDDVPENCVLVYMHETNSKRPKPGDMVFIEKATGNGEFGHMGVITKMENVHQRVETWTVVAGGGGFPAQEKEAITKHEMTVDTWTLLTNSAGRKLLSWTDTDLLLR